MERRAPRRWNSTRGGGGGGGGGGTRETYDIECDDGRGGGIGIEMPKDETNHKVGFETNGGYVGGPGKGRCEQDTKIAEDATCSIGEEEIDK